MKILIISFLYLNIYTFISDSLYAQQLFLEISAEKEISQSLIDSLNINFEFRDYNSLKSEIDTIAYKLQHFGYVDSSTESIEKINDTLYNASYYFGKKYSNIKIFYSESDFSKKEVERYATEVSGNYFIIPISQAEKVLQYLIALKTQSGNAFAKMSLSKLTKFGDSIKATLLYDARDKRIIDSLVIKGYDKFPKSYLRYYAGIKKGNSFNQKKLVTQNEILNSLGFVQSIKPPEALFRKDSTIVYFYLQKQNNNLFDGILGFATNEKTQKLEFNGYLNLDLNNNLNFGEQLLLNYKADGNDQKNFRVKTVLPYLFNSPFGLSAELAIFKRDSTFSTTDQQIRLLYQASPSLKGYVGYKSYVSSNLLDELNSTSDVKDYKSKYLLAGLEFKRYQNRQLFPIKTLFLSDIEVGKRDLKDQSDGQFKISGTLFNIFNLNFNTSIFLQNTTSVLFSNRYLTNELFRFGGINSIRGFAENSIDASLFSVINTEYRYLINPTIYVHSIIDVGYFENNVLQLKQKLYSFGLGLGFNTKAGIFKFNLANGNVENQSFKFSNTKIHISLSSKF